MAVNEFEMVTIRNDLIRYWLERDTVHYFYPIYDSFKTELISKTSKAKEADKRLCVVWKVRGML